MPHNHRNGNSGKELYKKALADIRAQVEQGGGRNQQRERALAVLMKEVETQFNKKFQFVRNTDTEPELPSVDTLFSKRAYSVEKLKKIKLDLNQVKSRLNDFEISDWHRHTRNRSSLIPVLNRLKYIGAEFVTQAFAKLYECVYAYNVVPENSTQYCSVHLCEAPGAFITGLNHYLKQNRPRTAWRWFANTLNPYYEGNCSGYMIPDDRFILPTLRQWCFGDDFTGDIMRRENVETIVTRAEKFKTVNLVTADGSIDCVNVPEAQEQRVSQLHMAETVVALKILSPGGCFILKMFTFFEHSSVNLLYLLYVCFEELHVFKPCTSKPGNSEVYVIAKGFRKPKDLNGYLDKIFENLYSTNAMFGLESLPQDFVEQVYQCAYTFMAFQAEVIEGNIYYYNRVDPIEADRLSKFKNLICNSFFDKYQIGRIQPSDAILYGMNIGAGSINMNPQDNFGTYNERSLISSYSGDARKTTLRTKLKALIHEKPTFLPDSRLSDCPQFMPNIGQDAIDIVCGKEIETVKSSKFAMMSYVRLLRETVNVILSDSDATRKSSESTPLYSLDCTAYKLTIDIKSYAKANFYDEFEKGFFNFIVNCITKLPMHDGIECLIIENWLLLTQFSVGVLLYLKSYVFEHIEAAKSGGKIRLSRLKPDGIAALRYLHDRLQTELAKCEPGKSVLGVVPTRLLLEGGFYYAVINYNNTLLLEYSRQLLGE
ncbi:cap-specific mRNA (nucleoside-2'-O-)-methyltransferase 2 [Uranotaenia lowii]|uniref:cap-specific mRNA (nucleoside-2'-O-)-methyltransferase 2 n=1 Tax=Uranotaenia lowii TaxID=190385 RepID=UPI00247ABB7D|nr:cap-specific mRNA (nucleoside-2'-O-)-methyltransferase 2 [Uranotaenia lowii]